MGYPRTGFGYDVHRFARGRRLILGGVEIPHEVGLDGHSDADVLVHAIMDALLGAAALGDIGKHFPPSEPRYRNASSIELLKQVRALLSEHQYTIVNIDSTVVLEAPKLLPHIERMRENIAAALNISPARVSIKATTSEGLGFIGHNEGAAAHAIVTIIAEGE